MAGVSISGYYKHKRLIILKQTKQEREEQDLKLIQEIVLQYKGIYGYRRVTMELAGKNITLNHKKVYRIMNKYDLLAKIRRKDPYCKMRKTTQEHSTAKNILNREFRGYSPFKKLGTDITYIRFHGKWLYLSIVKDMISGEILSAYVSDNLGIGIIYSTLKQLENLDLKGALIHSDQGFHYTHPCFKEGIKQLGMIQSMSRRGNCIDNAPTESFFGHMKDEIDLGGCKNLKEIREYMNNYIFYYNNKRPQWHKKKMTPVNYRNHLMSL